jgi:hypothetical protein
MFTTAISFILFLKLTKVRCLWQWREMNAEDAALCTPFLKNGDARGYCPSFLLFSAVGGVSQAFTFLGERAALTKDDGYLLVYPPTHSRRNVVVSRERSSNVCVETGK